jgi:hypothetical protein
MAEPCLRTVSLWPVEISGPDDVEHVFANIVADRAAFGVGLSKSSLAG